MKLRILTGLFLLCAVFVGLSTIYAQSDTGSASDFGTSSLFDKGEKYTVKLADSELKESIRFLARIAGLNVMIPEDLTGVVNVSFKSVGIMDAINSIVKANDLDYAIERGVLRVGKSGQFSKTGEDLQTETIRLKFATAKDLQDQVKTLVSERGSVLVDERTNSIVVRERAMNIESLRKFIEDVDIKDSQVLIEAKIVEVTRDFSRNLGIQWGVNNGGNRVNVTGLESVGQADSDRYLNVNLPAASPTSGLGLIIGKLAGATNIDIQLTAAEQKGDARIISEPSIVTSNGIAANIRSGETMYIKTTGDLNIGSSTASTSTGLHEIETGIELKVVPQISGGDLVKLKIDAATSQPDFSREVEGIPVVIDNTASTEVLVIDGQTTVIGGLAKFVGNDTVKAVPFFSKIPLFGNLFKSRAKSKRNTELMIFIKPTVVKPAEYLTQYNAQAEEVEEMKSKMMVEPLDKKKTPREKPAIGDRKLIPVERNNPHLRYRQDRE